MQSLQKRREKVHRLEQEFSEERRTIEEFISHAAFELEQQKRDTTDAEASCAGMRQQVETMRNTLEEMTRRVGQAETDTSQVRVAFTEMEAEVATLQSDIAV